MHEPLRRIPYRTWPGTLALLLGVGVYVGGLQLWDQHTPDTRALSAQKTVELAHVRFLPAPGWVMNVPRSRAGQSLLLQKNGHSFSVRLQPWRGGPEGPIARQKRLIVRGEQLRIEGELSAFLTDWGLSGHTFAYYGPQLSGRVWQIVDTARQAVVHLDLYGPNDDPTATASALDDALHMLNAMDLEAR